MSNESPTDLFLSPSTIAILVGSWFFHSGLDIVDFGCLSFWSDRAANYGSPNFLAVSDSRQFILELDRIGDAREDGLHISAHLHCAILYGLQGAYHLSAHPDRIPSGIWKNLPFGAKSYPDASPVRKTLIGSRLAAEDARKRQRADRINYYDG